MGILYHIFRSLHLILVLLRKEKQESQLQSYILSYVAIHFFFALRLFIIWFSQYFMYYDDITCVAVKISYLNLQRKKIYNTHYKNLRLSRVLRSPVKLRRKEAQMKNKDDDTLGLYKPTHAPPVKDLRMTLVSCCYKGQRS